MDNLITPHDFVDDCDCHQCSLRARDQLRTEVDRLRNIEAAAVAAVDFDQWQGDEWYESMMALQKALADSTEAVCQNCDGTGDVTNQIGEYLGRCNCGAPSMFQEEMAASIRFFPFEFEVWQDEFIVASASGTREEALREAMNYATQYEQDGPVRVFEVTRTLVTPNAPHEGRTAALSPSVPLDAVVGHLEER